MARVNTDYVIRSYTDDFGNNWNNIPVKIQEGAPKLDLIYDDRLSALACGGSIPFSPRRLSVTFNDGRKLLYPISSPGEIVTVATILKPSLLDSAIPGLGDDEAACIELIGEHWTILTPKAVGSLSYKNSPYTDIPKRGIKESGTYRYTSDITGVGAITLGYRFEKEPTDLLSCQKNGLEDATQGKGICNSSAVGITPRYLSLQAISKIENKESSVVRQIPTSLRSALKSIASQSADCAYCFGYKGESVKEISNFVGNTIGG